MLTKGDGVAEYSNGLERRDPPEFSRSERHGCDVLVLEMMKGKDQ